jgi:uncharacterized integral membrane protein
MRILIILAVLLALLVTIFAVQNITLTAIQFLFWNVTGSLALILMVTFSVGILIGLMIMIPGAVRGRLQSADFRRTIKSLESRLSEAHRSIETISTAAAQPQEQAEEDEA